MRSVLRVGIARAPRAVAARRAATAAATDADRHRSTIFDRRNVEFLLWEQPAFAAQAGDREGWLDENPLGVPTERECQTVDSGGRCYRVMLVRNDVAA